MEKKPTRPMTPFDEMTTPDGLRGVKLMLPYTPVSVRQKLAVLIKFMELQHTIRAFGHLSNALQSQELPSSPEEMLEELLPYLSPESADMLETFRNMMNMMEMVEMFQETDEFPSENENGSTDTDSSLKGSEPHERLDRSSPSEKSGSGETRTD